MTWTHISISCNCWRISRPGQLVTSTLGFPTVGNKLISPAAPLWEFPFLPIHSPCTSRIAHDQSSGGGLSDSGDPAVSKAVLTVLRLYIPAAPRVSATLRNRQRVPFAHECGDFLALVPVDNDQKFICSNGRVGTQGVVGHHEIDCSISKPAAQQVCHVDGSSLNTVVGTNDPKAVRIVAAAVVPATVAPVIPISVAAIRESLVPVIVVTAHVKYAHFHEAAFPVVEFTLLIPAVFSEDAERFIGPHSGISAHGLISDRDSAIHTAAPDQISENTGDIRALILEAVVGPHDLPAFFLCDHSCAKDAGANRENNHSEDKQHVSICKLHS